MSQLVGLNPLSPFEVMTISQSVPQALLGDQFEIINQENQFLMKHQVAILTLSSTPFLILVGILRVIMIPRLNSIQHHSFFYLS
jgi:hypothetical protein